MTSLVVVSVMIRIFVAEWIHFTHVGIILPTKTKSVNFLGLMDSATKGYGGLAAGLLVEGLWYWAYVS